VRLAFEDANVSAWKSSQVTLSHLMNYKALSSFTCQISVQGIVVEGEAKTEVIAA
jgi:hypothetical protein